MVFLVLPLPKVGPVSLEPTKTQGGVWPTAKERFAGTCGSGAVAGWGHLVIAAAIVVYLGIDSALRDQQRDEHVHAEALRQGPACTAPSVSEIGITWCLGEVVALL